MQKIAAGAPADVFFAANESFVDLYVRIEPLKRLVSDRCHG